MFMVVINFLRCLWTCYFEISQCTPITHTHEQGHATTCCPRGITFTEFALVSKGGVHLNAKWGAPSITGLFFYDMKHPAKWMFGDEFTFAESRSTYGFVL